MTYVEGVAAPGRARLDGLRALRVQRAGSFVAGWAILLDYLILIAVTAFAATNYLAAFWAPLGEGALELVIASASSLYVAVRNVRGFSRRRVGGVSRSSSPTSCCSC